MDNDQERQLTVAELIALLQKQPQDAIVFHEGCDCLGVADSVEYDASDNSVTIGRSN